MKKRWFGYAAWLLLACCLYFFENNTGTRAVLLCSLLFPLIPPLCSWFFSPDASGKAKAPEELTVASFVLREADEPGDVRPYIPGDPVRRIHWKLSAKKDELLIRETATEVEPEEERIIVSASDRQKNPSRRRIVAGLAFALLVCLVLLLLIPGANRGAQALCNRLFAASEKVNAYAYDYFPVPEDQSIALAAGLLILSAFIALALLLRKRILTLGIMAACTLFQAYFGLAFPAWVNIPLYGLLALRMMNRPFRRRRLLIYGAAILLVSLLTALLLPGVDAATEAASETVRDHLSQIAQTVTGAVTEMPEGETETRHTHTEALKTGMNEARTDREYRLVTVEEEQISMPHWVNYLKMILLLLLSVALLILPFAPFLLLNTRKKKAQEARKAFASEQVGDAVCAIFRQVIAWLNETGHGAGNLLYRDWAEQLPDLLPDGYAARFALCAEDFEEAAYSGHALSEEKRLRALELLRETEAALWERADWKQRFLLKYWMCLRE
ncbi:MAG: DUF58 domain-containing protein [Clostridia bacterium]|nr:DUF58 domain-containing protein [Clostridia bacterium]